MGSTKSVLELTRKAVQKHEKESTDKKHIKKLFRCNVKLFTRSM